MTQTESSHAARQDAVGPFTPPDSPPFLRLDFEIQSPPKHVALIMDGNRRWARARGLPDFAGHRAGAAALEALLPAIAGTPVETLTVFGFAAANWQRSRREVGHLLHLLEARLSGIGPRCVEAGIAVEVIGRRDRLPDPLPAVIEQIEQATSTGGRRLRLALDYSSREAILKAARDLPATGSDMEFSARIAGRYGNAEVDLLIRTGREQRLSDFLLWECAFAELYFPDIYWPDFDASTLKEALFWYGRRQRRMGR